MDNRPLSIQHPHSHNHVLLVSWDALHGCEWCQILRLDFPEQTCFCSRWWNHPSFTESKSNTLVWVSPRSTLFLEISICLESPWTSIPIMIFASSEETIPIRFLFIWEKRPPKTMYSSGNGSHVCTLALVWVLGTSTDVVTVAVGERSDA